MTSCCIHTCIALAVWGADVPATQPASDTQTVLIQLAEKSVKDKRGEQPFMARFTSEELTSFIENRPELLPLPMQLDAQRREYDGAMRRIAMGELLTAIEPWLRDELKSHYAGSEGLIVKPVPLDQQVTIEIPESEGKFYRGPDTEIVGFLLHNLTIEDYLKVTIRILQKARQLLDTGNALYDRTSPDHYRLVAQREVDGIVSASHAARQTEAERAQVRKRIGEALGVYDPKTEEFNGQANWIKESRRFSYIITKQGEFIEKLRPIVETINKNMNMAGFQPPSPLDRAGIYYDPDLEDVEITLPKPIMERFLKEADALEERMALAAVISIEAVRLTDREIVDGALAMRLNMDAQGVHNVHYFDTRRVAKELGLNTLLAVANQQLQISTLEAIQGGDIPVGVDPVQIAPPELPPLQTDTTYTTVGSNFSIGADDIFFDGREQTYGFSYIDPNGVQHTVGLQVVDSLREFWSRIERNLIVHKIKKVEEPTPFSVPVGPESKSFDGIAALISQENQQLVVATGTGAISEISATAGTWLVIKDFRIDPIPGSSTALTEVELEAIRNKVLMTMFLRDPMTPVEEKVKLLEAESNEELTVMLDELLASCATLSIRPGRKVDTYERVLERRYKDTLDDAAASKKEQNSVITLSFYSSQGNIIQTPGSTQLGDNNDLTSFTTELRPNVVTPISSFFTKRGSGAKGTSALTGVSKGQSKDEEKSMTHLLIRARFPSVVRERADLEEGRYMGYFDLPISQEPNSSVDLPFLSSSDHPLDRLSRLRTGLMFEILQRDKVRRPLDLVNPNAVGGSVAIDVYETATTRMLMMRRLIADSPNANQILAAEYLDRFIVEVRSLLEYDEDFFAAPNFALRNMDQWNDPERIIIALNMSTDKFAFNRLIGMVDELGEILLPDEYIEDYLGYSPSKFMGGHEVFPLTDEQIRFMRRDVAIHYMRFQECYGDAFLEAASLLMGTGTYRAESVKQLKRSPLDCYQDLVVYNRSGKALAEPQTFEEGLEQFIILKHGGYGGGLFEKSLKTLEDLPKEYRQFAIRGREIVEAVDWW